MRVIVDAGHQESEDEEDERLEAYHRVQAYQTNPRQTVAQYVIETDILRSEIQAARDLLPQVKLSDQLARQGLAIIREMHIDSLRAEITFFESARAYAAADGRLEVQKSDLDEVALLALRLRRSNFMLEFFSSQQSEESELRQALERTLKNEPKDES